mgnify:FL=1
MQNITNSTIQKLNWDDVKLILSVQRSNSLSEIAADLKLDSTTVSRRLTIIEKTLNSVIFVRSHGSIELSLLGKKLLPFAESMENSSRAISAEISSHNNLLEGNIRVSAPPTFARCYLAPNLFQFKKSYPGISLEFDITPTNIDLSKWEADISIRLALPKGDQNNVIVRKLGEIPYAPFSSASPENPNEWICYGPEFSHLPEMKWIAEKLDGAAPILRSNDPEMIAAAAANGLGNAMLPVILADRVPGLVQQSEVVFHKEVWLLQNKDMARAVHTKEFTKWLVQLCKKSLI